MENTDAAGGKRNAFCGKVKPGFQKTGRVFQKIVQVLAMIGRFFYRFRKIFMAIPVVIASAYLANRNAGMLPETVGIFIQANGQYLLTISRQVAVGAPLVVTGACLVLMFCSRRALYPWIISLFTLVLPFFMMVSTIFPA